MQLKFWANQAAITGILRLETHRLLIDYFSAIVGVVGA